ncbi:MAG: PEGA domain-containing protein [Pseudomonadales bacterium]
MNEPINLPQRLDPAPDVIAPVHFEPAGASSVQQRVRLKPTFIVLLVAGFVAALVLLFLFTAKSIQIETDPGDADYAISGGIAIKLGQRYLLRPGDYQLQASHKAYYPLQQDFSVSAAERQRLEFKLQRLPDVLGVSSTPAGATLTIDGESKGVTPLENIELPPGEYELQLHRERYLPYLETIKVEGGNNALQKSLALAPAWAEISIGSVPNGATLLVDGAPRGSTPVTAEVLQGKHTLAVKLLGYKTWSTELEVEPSKAQQLKDVVLEKADAVLQVQTTPAKAGILVDGVFRGQSPLELYLNPGKQYQIDLFKTGYQKTNRKINLQSGEQQKLNVAFKPLIGEILVVTKPADAQLSVDGVSQKTANARLKLPARAHTIRVTKTGFKPFVTTVTPKPGFPQRVNVTLVTLQQAKLQTLKTSINAAAGQKMILQRPDSFTMGASRREPGRRANEVIRNIKLTRPFYLAANEVSNAEFRKYEEPHSSGRAGDKSLNGDKQPVVRVTWIQAARYCNWLSERDKLKPVYTFEDEKLVGVDNDAQGYRLPTEAEWAWAARKTATGMLKYSWGKNLPPPENAGNFADHSASYLVGQVIAKYNDSFPVTAPVGSFPASHRQLHDMGGNVAEWIHDYYGQLRPVSDKPELDPTGPEKGKFHVIRGSSWRHGSPVELRLSFRDYGEKARDDVGFRIARNAE